MNNSIIINNKTYKPLKEYLNNIKIENHILKDILQIIKNRENVSRKKKTDFLLHSINGVVYATDDITAEIEKLYPQVKKQYEF